MSQTVTINGTVYDGLTGLPVSKADPAPQSQARTNVAQPAHAHAVHQQMQKSHTLNRQVVKKSTPTVQTSRPRMDIQRSSKITKFAPHPSGASKHIAINSDVAPITHPMTQKAHKQMDMAKPTTNAAPKPSHMIKQEAVAKALNDAPSHHQANTQVKNKSRFSRAASVMSATFALLLLAGYFAYINMPHLSVRVAAAQAGIDASYPSYKPDGYSLAGPIAYDQGKVDMKFASNSGPQNFTIKQSKTNWDSSAVQENYVKEKWGNDFMPYSERGLTIYAHDGNAVWVNGGILYSIEGDAPLSASQIRALATSL